MEQAGEAPDDRVQDAVARNPRRQGRGRRDLAGRRPGERGACGCSATRSSSPRPPRGCSSRDEQDALSVGQARHGPEVRALVARRRGAGRRGRRPGGPHARASAMSSWTRRRTCRRCSAARSGGAARPARRRCSATSRRAPRRGRPPTGSRCCATSASRRRSRPCWTVATASRARSSTSRAACFPTIAPELAAPVSVRSRARRPRPPSGRGPTRGHRRRVP